jgi:hypothetical protein
VLIGHSEYARVNARPTTMDTRRPEFRIKRAAGMYVLWFRPTRTGVWTLSLPLNETNLAREIDRYLDKYGRAR